MKVLFKIDHPAHVHLFKNIIAILEKEGHETEIVTRNKDVTLKLLDAYKLKYTSLGQYYHSKSGKAYDFISTNLKLLNIALKTKPDILFGVGDPYVAYVGKLIGKPSLVFTDTEDAKLANKLTFPFATEIFTPECYLKDLGKKHIRFKGYKELAYLHPNNFKPDISVLEELDVSKEKFIIIRLISWKASHDFNLKGLKKDSEMEFIRQLEDHGRVFLTSERELNNTLEKYKLSISPEKMHSLLHFARLYIGEGGTMAAEAAILGTPSIHIESTKNGIASGELSGNFLELRDKYQLLYFYPDQNQAFEKALEIMEDKNSKEIWSKRREKLLNDKIDVAAWMSDFIKNYPESFDEYRRMNTI